MLLNLDGYTLAFADEFTGTSLNTSVWGTRYWWGGRTLPSNGERQYFADPTTAVVQNHPATDPFRIAADPTQPGDGILTITARPSPDAGLTGGLPYVSGMINTHGTFSQAHGYFEIDAQVPSGQGLWPAFWLLPQSGAWPPEIDVMEVLGRDPTTYHPGAHWKGADGSHQFQTTAVSGAVDLSQDFHTYGTLWTPGTLTFFLDGRPVSSMATPAGLNEPMYLLAGLMVGGTWGGNPDATTGFPAEFKIDAIRAWLPPAATPVGQTLTGTSAADTLTGGAGGDTLSGLSGNDRLYGLAGDDHLTAGLGADRLSGGDGNDTLSGDKGADRLTGGAGADVFVFHSVGDTTLRGRDTINDFLSGFDMIDLRAIDANAKTAGDEAFAFLGSKAFTGQAGQLRLASGILSGDVNGDRRADFELALAGVAGLKAGDFYL
ncbi:MAG TPA: family 16 glycosylhydrolase [Microvirga sp.]|jgi:beta-glucanase (GH16 family)|nr:family 16 glycosylhydrolase [Microvirga sp.]